MSEKIIGIGGGVGPEASTRLQAKINQQVESGGTDQGNPEIHHFSRPHDIPDRTDFLLGKIETNPAKGMLRTAKMLEATADIAGKKAVMGIPCNTFHAPSIFEEFLSLLKEHNVKIEVLNMLQETADFIETNFPDVKKLGLMSTTGTRKVGVYKQILEPLGFSIVEVPENMQVELHETIYNKEWGIKAQSNPVTKSARDNFLRFSEVLSNQGIGAIILGCTEIPLALPEKKLENVMLIDPVFILARALVREATKDKLRPIDGI